MSNWSIKLELSVEVQTGPANISNLTENATLMDSVKTIMHSGAFVVTGIFTFLILVTVKSTRELQRNTGYILLCQHCICITGFNAAATVMHSIRALHVPTVRLACWLLFDVQVVFARGLMVTLTLMSLKTCVSVCWPLRSPDLIHRSRHFIVFTAWLLVFFNPVVFTVLSCINTPWQKLKAQETPCSTALEGSAPRISGLAQLGVLMILIVASYVLIYLEGYRAGHFSQANSKGQRTILIHGLQMGLHVLPSLIIILRLRKSLAVEITNLIVFCVAQSASPIVYGLRCRDIWIQLPQFIRVLLPCHSITTTTDNTPHT